MTDFGTMAPWIAPIKSVSPKPVDGDALVDRLRLTAVSLGYALTMAPALALAILSILCVPLGLVFVGFALAFAVVPATAWLTAGHRRVSRSCSGSGSAPSTPTPRTRTWSPDRCAG